MSTERKDVLIWTVVIEIVLAILVLINRRPLGDVILMILMGLVLIGALVLLFGGSRGKRNAAAKVKGRANAPWTAYARPDANGDWRIGVERVYDGVTIEQVEMFHMPPPVEPAGDVEVRARVLEAKFRAQTYNELRSTA
jgi:hypothetical protein